MKSKLLITALLALLVGIYPLLAQEYHVEKPGTLSQVVGEKAKDLTTIRVTGIINHHDIYFLRELANDDPEANNQLFYIDLEDATLVENALPEDAFYLSQIIEYKLPKGLTRIGNAAFAKNTRLCKIIIPQDVTEIEENAFSFCEKLEEIDLPSRLTTLEAAVFMGCTSLKKVTLPENLTTIGESAFEQCLSLSQIFLPSNLKEIHTKAFFHTGLKRIEVPKKVETIGKEAFSNCESLARVDLTGKISIIGEKAFFNCSKLNVLNITEAISTIGDYAFCGGAVLYYLTLHEGVKVVGERAFANMLGFRELVLPSSIKVLHREAFAENHQLREIFCKAPIPPVIGKASDESSEEDALGSPFKNCDVFNLILYVPKGSKDLYMQSEIFREFYAIRELEAWQFPTPNEVIPPHYDKGYSIKAHPHGLTIEIHESLTGAEYKVYALDGILLQKGRLKDIRTDIELPQGMYIVEIDQYHEKTLVQ